MNAERFEKLVDNRLAHCRKVLLEKNEEYSRNNERLHNFKTAARIDDVVPESALWGMMRKHIVSMRDMVADAEKGIAPTTKMLDEKVTDTINYSLLLEALLVERMIGERMEKETTMEK